MATRWAVASGNWSNTATWNGGTLPASTDDVHANNFTVTIDQDVTANSLSIAAGGSAVQGGLFIHSSGTHAVTLQSLAVGAHTGSSTALLELSGGSVSLSVAGTIEGDSASAGSEPPAVLVSGGTHTINAAVVLGGSGVAGSIAIVVSGSSALLDVNAFVSGAVAPAISLTGTNAQLTVVGEIVGGSVTGGYGVTATAGFFRADAVLAWSTTGVPPYSSQNTPMQFVRTGSELALRAPSDDNWPAATGVEIVVERYTTGNPLPEDVREGTLYGPGDTSTGTLAVPPPASVAAGVPTDDTVGSAALALSDLAAVTGAQIAAATTG